MLQDTGQMIIGALGAAPCTAERHNFCQAFTTVHVCDLLERHLRNANMLGGIKHVHCADPQLCKDC